MSNNDIYTVAIEKLRELHKKWSSAGNRAAKEIEEAFPELAEGKDEKMSKKCIELIKELKTFCMRDGQNECIAWLEKIGEQKPRMIQWKGNNLNEVIAFTGKDKNFDKWFKSFEEYEKYVHEHNDIFKLFNEDGSHYEVPVGAWIVKTPDGRNVASKAVLKQKPAEWSEEDENHVKSILSTIECCKAQFPNAQAVVEAYIADIEWLKSIKDRIQVQSQWKPNDEQIQAVKAAACYSSVFSQKIIDNLISLSQQLKKLREE